LVLLFKAFCLFFLLKIKRAHKAGSHSKIGWDIFTDKVIKVISEKNNGCVFLLWGAFAQVN
jgi:uracil DNA glycosylase